MAIDLIVDVLDHAPADLTPAELAVLLVIAEHANLKTRTAKEARSTWDLASRARMSERMLAKTLRSLAARGLEVRVQITTAKNPEGVFDRAGRPVYACRGHATNYRIPRFDLTEKALPDREPNVDEKALPDPEPIIGESPPDSVRKPSRFGRPLDVSPVKEQTNGVAEGAELPTARRFPPRPVHDAQSASEALAALAKKGIKARQFRSLPGGRTDDDDGKTEQLSIPMVAAVPDLPAEPVTHQRFEEAN